MSQILSKIIEVARNSGIDPATLRDWEQNAHAISKSSKGSRRLPGGGRYPLWLQMEVQLVKEFTTARNKGISIPVRRMRGDLS